MRDRNQLATPRECSSNHPATDLGAILWSETRARADQRLWRSLRRKNPVGHSNQQQILIRFRSGASGRYQY